MNILGRIARADFSGFENAGVALDANPWVEAFKGGGSEAGRTVTVANSLAVAGVWSAVRILSDTIGTLPLVTYRLNGVNKERAVDARVYDLLHEQPNPEMTAATLWGLVVTYLNTWGNAYLGKTKRGRNVTELWPIRPDRVRVWRENGRKMYGVRDANGVETKFTSDDIIHIHGITLDGLTGLSPVAMARESIGAAMAMDQYTNTFFREGALPRMVLRHKGRLTGDGKRNLRRQWEQRYRGSARANRVAVLEEDVDVKILSLPQRDLEFVEQRGWTLQELARWFRVPVSMLEGDKGGSSMTYRTVEGDSIAFVTHSVRPWAVRIEQAINNDRDLFPSNTFGCEFLVDSLLRGETLARYQAFQIALDPNTGWMLPSEVRVIENLSFDARFDHKPVPVTASGAPPPPTPPPIKSPGR